MASIDLDRLNAVSARLGEVVLDPTTWPILMEEVCRAVGTTGAALIQSDARTPDIPMTSSAKEIFKSYFENNLHINDVRAVRGVPMLLAGFPVVSDRNLFGSEREMLLDPLYINLDNFGFRWWAAVGFMSGSALWGLSLQRTKREGQFEAFELAALSQLSRRLTETATLSKEVGRLVLFGSTNALQLVRRPAIAIDRYGYVIEANQMALDLFDDEIRVRNRRIIVRDKAARSSLAALIDMVSNSSDTQALPAPPIVVRRETKPPLIIRTLPVDGAARSPFLGARAILTIHDSGARPKLEQEVVLKAFGLTPAEARLAVRIAAGMSLEQAAEGLGIGKETSRRHLKAIFAKTETHRQGQLVALLSQL
jgi:DNA-binding CsgD family transcriptional regulator